MPHVGVFAMALGTGGVLPAQLENFQLNYMCVCMCVYIHKCLYLKICICFCQCGEVHMSIDAHRVQRHWILLGVEVFMVVSCLAMDTRVLRKSGVALNHGAFSMASCLLLLEYKYSG